MRRKRQCANPVSIETGPAHQTRRAERSIVILIQLTQMGYEYHLTYRSAVLSQVGPKRARDAYVVLVHLRMARRVDVRHGTWKLVSSVAGCCNQFGP